MLRSGAGWCPTSPREWWCLSRRILPLARGWPRYGRSLGAHVGHRSAWLAGGPDRGGRLAAGNGRYPASTAVARPRVAPRRRRNAHFAGPRRWRAGDGLSPGRAPRHARRAAGMPGVSTRQPSPPIARTSATRSRSARTSTEGPAPEMTAAWPAARRASTSAIDSAYEVRRASWCSHSRVAASRCSGAAPRAWASRAARPELAAASARRTCCGSTERALAVESCTSGTKTTGSTSGCTGRCTVVVPTPSSSVHDRVAPPCTLADALSGWPSSRDARLLAKARSTSSPASPRERSCRRLGRDDAGHDRGRRRAHPPSVRHGVAAVERQARGRLDAELGPGHLHRAVHQVGGVERHGTLALTRDRDHEAGALR